MILVDLRRQEPAKHDVVHLHADGEVVILIVPGLATGLLHLPIGGIDAHRMAALAGERQAVAPVRPHLQALLIRQAEGRCVLLGDLHLPVHAVIASASRTGSRCRGLPTPAGHMGL